MDDPLLERLRRALGPEFKVDRQLGAGGMGIVFGAREVALNRLVAIKVLRPELATAVARERFLRESRLLARLQHPNIVPVHRAGESDGLSYYVMDFIEGPTLADRLEDGRLLEVQVLRLARDLVEALAAAHAVGIIHRDVKPHNIFFIGHRALLGDFGVAYDTASDSLELTEDGALVGTRAYMAPEQLRGESATVRSDQYSAAAVLFEAATGRRWQALDAPADADWSGVPRPMVPLLRRGLAVDPARRWSSMRAARAAFDRERFRRRWLPATPARALAVAIVVAAAGLLAIRLIGGVAAGAPSSDHRTLAVLPFTVVGAPEDPLGREVAEVTYINLYWFPNLTRADFDRSAAWQRDHPGEDPVSAARALDVSRVITGKLERRADTLQLQLIIPDSGAAAALTPIRISSAGGDARDLGRQAAIAIGMQLGGRPGAEQANLASRSPEAVGQFLTGEAQFDDDAWHLAARSYAGAVAFDSSFALARWRRLVARLWSREGSWEEAAELARCCADQLPPLESGLVRALSDTNLPARFHAFDSLQKTYGSDGSLPLLLASDLFHRGPLVGRSITAALDVFETAIRVSPAGTPAPAYDHMIWGKMRLGERQEAAAWLTARRRLAVNVPGEPPIVEFLQLGYDTRWVPWRAGMKLWALQHLGSESTIQDLAKFFRFSAAFDLPEAQDAVGRVVASRLLSADRASGLEAQGLAQLTWGRVKEGLADIDSAARYFKTDEAELQRRQWRLLLPLLGAGEAGEEEEESARLWLAERTTDEPYAERAQWTLALDALRRQDTAVALGWIDRLARRRTADSVSTDLAALAAAMIEGARDPRRALAATTPLLRFDSPRPGQDIFTRSLLHLSRARWFEAAGDLAGARREILWYENSDTYRFPTGEAQKMEVDAVASVSARLTRARLLLDAGERDAACLMLRRVHQLWTGADPSLGGAKGRADSLHRERCR
ncbi:MAG TPA: serine/threonine-protein kinase [Gemmatimonadales bacterium]|nr:serine/threonine-protein kinase [Gemmatimonadales bacterium]